MTPFFFFIDTSVWSLVLRRKLVDDDNPHVRLFRSHVEKGDSLYLIGIILQELLDGVRSKEFFQIVAEITKPFPFLVPSRQTYIEAARLSNSCRAKGIQASPADFLIAATAIEHGYPLLTSDADFAHIAKHSSLQLISF